MQHIAKVKSRIMKQSCFIADRKTGGKLELRYLCKQLFKGY